METRVQIKGRIFHTKEITGTQYLITQDANSWYYYYIIPADVSQRGLDYEAEL